LTRVIVADASVLINLIHVDRLAICGGIPGQQFVVPDHVVAEASQPAQRERLATAISRGLLDTVRIEDLDTIATFVTLTERLGRGESACLALAQAQGYSIASDERGLFRRMTIEMLGAHRLITTPDVYVAAIRARILTVAEADADKAILEGRRFRMGFTSFADILDRA
jgi:predicted nucleic acid-binding protein